MVSFSSVWCAGFVDVSLDAFLFCFVAWLGLIGVFIGVGGFLLFLVGFVGCCNVVLLGWCLARCGVFGGGWLMFELSGSGFGSFLLDASRIHSGYLRPCVGFLGDFLWVWSFSVFAMFRGAFVLLFGLWLSSDVFIVRLL